MQGRSGCGWTGGGGGRGRASASSSLLLLPIPTKASSKGTQATSTFGRPPSPPLPPSRTPPRRAGGVARRRAPTLASARPFSRCRRSLRAACTLGAPKEGVRHPLLPPTLTRRAWARARSGYFSMGKNAERAKRRGKAPSPSPSPLSFRPHLDRHPRSAISDSDFGCWTMPSRLDRRCR